MRTAIQVPYDYCCHVHNLRPSLMISTIIAGW